MPLDTLTMSSRHQERPSDITNQHLSHWKMQVAFKLGNTLKGMKARITSYFDNAEDGAPQDPLLDVVRLHPGRSVKFIKVTMFVGLITTGLIASGVLSFLSLWWDQCSTCNRPLRWWLLIHTVLQLVQLPVRFVFLLRLQCCVTNEE